MPSLCKVLCPWEGICKCCIRQWMSMSHPPPCSFQHRPHIVLRQRLRLLYSYCYFLLHRISVYILLPILNNYMCYTHHYESKHLLNLSAHHPPDHSHCHLHCLERLFAVLPRPPETFHQVQTVT